MYYGDYHREPQEPIETNQYRVHDPWDNGSAPAPAPRKKGSGAKIVALALCCALAGGLVGGGSAWYLSRSLGSGESTTLYEGQHEPINVDTASVKSGDVLSAAQIYAANVDACVGITTELVTQNTFGFPVTGAAAGSGFVISADGYIVTNYHVIKGATAIKVAFVNGQSYDAKLVGGEAENDVAVLKIDAAGLTPVKLGDSDSLVVGESVYTIGNPLGELTFSLTAGVVSALDREVTLSGNVTMELIQTDCAINSGNSGGALFNLYGEVIGITNAKYSSSGSGASIDNIGFAIPINSVMNIVESIIEKGYIAKPYIGVSVTSVSSETQSYGLPKGAAVKAISEDSPAEKAGLQINDIITAANGTTIESSDDLVRLVGDLYDGAELQLTIYRQGETVELTVIVGEKIQSALGSEDDQAQVQQQSSQRQFSFPGFFNFGY